MEDRNLYGRAVGIDKRGRHASFGSAVDAAFKDLVTERNAFFDTVTDRWEELFPGVPAVPGRYEGGLIFLYVRSAPLLFSLRPKLRSMELRLAALEGAPKRVSLRLEIHSR